MKTIQDKIFDSVLDLLSTGQKISAYSLEQHAGLSRNTIQYYIKKKKNNQNKG